MCSETRNGVVLVTRRVPCTHTSRCWRSPAACTRRIPDNQQAASDYAIALTRVAALLPAHRFTDRLARLRESLKLLREIGQVNPQNFINRWDLSHGCLLLGDALIASDRAGAIRAYEESLWWRKD